MSDERPMELPFGADIRLLESQLNRAVNALNRSMDTMERRAATGERKISGGINGALAKIDTANLDHALGKVFDSSRLAVLEEGSAKLRVFGSALEPLGAIGIAAAAGIVAVSAAVEQAMKTAEWAEDLEKTAKALDLTTTSLQEFDFVAQATGIPVATMRENIGQLTKTIGQLDDNLLRTKNGPQVKVFEAIFGTNDPKKAEDALRQLGGVEQVLPVILDYAAKLNDVQRAGLAKALQIDPVVLNSLVEAKDKISGLIAEAHHYGLIVDEDVVRKSADAAEQMHVAKTVIDDELRVAFAGLSTDAANAATGLLHVADRIGDVVRGAQGALGPLQDLINKLLGVASARDAANRPNGGYVGQAPPEGATDPVGAFFHGLTGAMGNDLLGGPIMGPLNHAVLHALAGQGAAARSNDELVDVLGKGVEPKPKPTDPLVPDSGKHGGGDRGAARLGEAQERYLEALARAAKSLDEAHTDRLALIQQRYVDAVQKALTEKGLKPDERQKLVDTAALTRDADVEAENASFRRAQSEHLRAVTDQLTKSLEDQLAAQAEISGSLSDRQALERQRLVDEQAQARADLMSRLSDDKQTKPLEAIALLVAQYRAQHAQLDAQAYTFAQQTAAQQRDNQIALLKSEDDELQASLSLARTRKERQALQQKILDNERAMAQAQLAKDTAEQHLTPDQVAARQAGIDATYGARTQANAQANAGPLAQFAAGAPRNGSEALQQAGDQAQGEAVQFLDTLNGGLADAVVHGKSLGDTLKKAFQNAEQDALNFLLKMAEQAAIKEVLSIIPGFAGGTRAAPGGLAVVGERGREIVNLPRGAEVIPNSISEQLLRQLPGYADGIGAFAGMSSLNGAGARGMQISVHSSYDMRGTSGDDAINRKIAQSEERTTGRVLATVKRQLPSWQAQRQAEAG